jgi:serine phosphatase RsbU (regulator of sigma subunit)
MGHRPASSSVSRLIFVSFAAIAFVSIASFGFLSYRSKEKLLLQGIDRQLATGAYAVAQALPADWHDREAVTEADDYKNILSLSTLARRAELSFLYSFASDPETGVYFTSTNATDEQLDSGTWLRKGTPYKARQEIVELFKDERGLPLTLEGADEFGAFRSVLIPQTSPGGKRYVVGADLYIDKLRREILQQFWGAVGAAAAVFAIVALGSVYLSKRIARPIVYLEQAVENLNQENLSRPSSELTAPFEKVGQERTDEIGKLGLAFARMLQRLELAQTHLRTEIQERERLENELKVTRKIQQLALPLPEELAEVRGLDLASFIRPAESVGGDYYDVLPQKGSLRVGMGDVADHGLESGIFMLMIQTAARTLVELGVRDPKLFLSTINATLYKNVRRLKTDRNATLTYVEFEPGRLLISGQHEEILLIKASGDYQLVDTTNLGFPVGMIEEIGPMLDVRQVDVGEGDLVILYTDGVTEAENAAQTLFGIDRLIDSARRNRESNAETIKDAIVQEVMDHVQDHTIYDDIALVVVKIC